ncbi:MAG: hypothetical protein COB76_01490 [Alphaproteobacteria bacterium]|nr:MAG: hypothetical protein COB76_01490 [Alphaproteobacteria bacterium]
MIKSEQHPADVINHPDMKHIERALPDIFDLTQDDVDFIATWAGLYTKNCKNNHLKITWPTDGTWPNWPDTVDVNGNAFPCISPARKTSLEEKNEITPLSTAAKHRETAIQKRLNKFAALKI